MPIKKEHDNDKTSTYKIKFIGTCRLMPSKLSEILLITCLRLIIRMERKTIKSECKFIGFKENRLNYRSKECNRTSTKSINELIEKLPITYQCCNGDFTKFFLFLRKGVYPYKHMDSWEKFKETSLPAKEDFYSELTLEGISDK